MKPGVFQGKKFPFTPKRRKKSLGSQCNNIIDTRHDLAAFRSKLANVPWLRSYILVALALSCFPHTLSQQLTQFSPTQPLWPAPQYPLRAASQQLSPMLFPGGFPTLGSPVRGSLPVGQVQQVLFGPLPVQQQQQMQQQQVQAAAQQVGSPEQQQQQQQQQVQPRQQQPQVQAQFQSPPPGPRTGFAFSSDFKNRMWPNQNSTICAQGPDWAWLKDVTPAYLFEVAFYKFWRQRATAIAKIPDGAVKPCWHDESITGHWCSLANLLNPSVPPQEGQAACGHCKVEEYELLFSWWASYGWGHVRTHTPPGATAKTVHHFYFNKDPPSFINATDAGAMAFKNECASVRSAGASLLRGSAKKGASAARALATGAKVKTTAVKDEEQPQQQQVQSSSSNSRQPCSRQHCSCSSSSSGCRWPSNSSNNNNNWHRHRYALCLPLRALSTLLRALHLL